MKYYCIMVTVVTGRQFKLIYDSKELALKEFDEMLKILNMEDAGFIALGPNQDIAINVSNVVCIEILDDWK